MRDEFLPPPERAQQGELTSSVALGLNAIDWLAQEDALIAIRAKNVEDPMIETQSHDRRTVFLDGPANERAGKGRDEMDRRGAERADARYREGPRESLAPSAGQIQSAPHHQPPQWPRQPGEYQWTPESGNFLQR